MNEADRPPQENGGDARSAGGDQCYSDGVATLDIWKLLNRGMIHRQLDLPGARRSGVLEQVGQRKPGERYLRPVRQAARQHVRF